MCLVAVIPFSKRVHKYEVPNVFGGIDEMFFKNFEWRNSPFKNIPLRAKVNS